MPADDKGLQPALARGIARVLEGISEVQGVPGEEDVMEYAEFDGSELPPIDTDTVVSGDQGVRFQLRSGHWVHLMVHVSVL